jgi:hypothetical protein
MAARGAIDLELDAFKARLDLLEEALGALLDEKAKTPKPKSKKAEQAKEPE